MTAAEIKQTNYLKTKLFTLTSRLAVFCVLLWIISFAITLFAIESTNR
jgi:hypothetical protein